MIHKLTPFIKEERIGLLNGLRGVDAVDLIEINETPLRYVASKPLGNGKFDEDRWPVKRGTVVKLDDYTALVWVHGVAAAIDPQRKYFQGKRRIPAPLLIRRHAGESDLVTVADEILALSKMDWNSFDMYKRLPATVHSSGEIARIGALLQRFGKSVVRLPVVHLTTLPVAFGAVLSWLSSSPNADGPALLPGAARRCSMTHRERIMRPQNWS